MIGSTICQENKVVSNMETTSHHSRVELIKLDRYPSRSAAGQVSSVNIKQRSATKFKYGVLTVMLQRLRLQKLKTT